MSLLNADGGRGFLHNRSVSAPVGQNLYMLIV